MKKYQKDDLTSYTLGTTLTIELLHHQLEHVTKIVFKNNFIQNETYELIMNLIKDTKIEVINSDKIINKLSSKDNCYVIGEFNKYELKLDHGNHLLFVNPENEGNFGTIIRSALGFGINNIAIIKPGIDIFNPSLIRSSMGAIFNVNIEYFSSTEEYKSRFNNNLYPFMLKAKNNITNIEFKQPYTLIFGPESSGLDDSYLNEGTPVVIKHSNLIDSLNLPIAVSIALYESDKQISKKNWQYIVNFFLLWYSINRVDKGVNMKDDKVKELLILNDKINTIIPKLEKMIIIPKEEPIVEEKKKKNGK